MISSSLLVFFSCKVTSDSLKAPYETTSLIVARASLSWDWVIGFKEAKILFQYSLSPPRAPPDLMSGFKESNIPFQYSLSPPRAPPDWMSGFKEANIPFQYSLPPPRASLSSDLMSGFKEANIPFQYSLSPATFVYLVLRPFWGMSAKEAPTLPRPRESVTGSPLVVEPG